MHWTLIGETRVIKSWTFGIVFGKGKGIFVLKTEYGVIHVKVVYINGRPFVLRDVEQPFSNLEYTELSRFIATRKLHCKIDKVAGVVETNRPDAKNALYQATIKQGDFLLNQIQKLSHVIDL